MLNFWWKEDNWTTLKKYLERRRNPAVNGVCDEDNLTRMEVNNSLHRIGSRPIKFENVLPPEKQALISKNQVKYVEGIIVTRDTAKLGMSRQAVIQTTSEI